MIRFLARAAALAVAALILFALQQTTPGYSEITGPIRQAGIAGETATARGFTVRIEKIVLAEAERHQKAVLAKEEPATEADLVWLQPMLDKAKADAERVMGLMGGGES